MTLPIVSPNNLHKPLLGKAYVFQKNYGAAATVLDEVINSGKYDLYSDYENIQTTKGEANCESLI